MALRRCTAWANAACAAWSPKNSSGSGRPKRKRWPKGWLASCSVREYGSCASGPCATCSTRAAMATVRAKMDTQSTLCAAGTTPRALSNPRPGLMPTMLFTPAPAPHPPAGLNADDVVQPGRHAARAGGVGAQGEVDLAGGHHIGRAGTGAARHIVGMKRIRHRPVGRARAVEAAGKLVEVGFAHQACTSVEQLAHHCGVLPGPVGKIRAGRGGGAAQCVDVVLDGKAQPGQRAGAAACQGLREAFYPGLRGARSALHHGRGSVPYVGGASCFLGT